MKCSSEGLSTARSSGKNEMVAGIAFAMLFAALGAPAAALAADQAAAAASGDWFDPFVNFNAGTIAGIDGVVGSGGVAIILYTIIVKAVTFPLQQPALRTTTLLRLTSPQTETIQKEYKDDEDQKNQMLRRLYDEVGINPLNVYCPYWCSCQFSSRCSGLSEGWHRTTTASSSLSCGFRTCLALSQVATRTWIGC